MIAYLIAILTGTHNPHVESNQIAKKYFVQLEYCGGTYLDHAIQYTDLPENARFQSETVVIRLDLDGCIVYQTFTIEK